MPTINPQYRDATRSEAKACIAIEGTSGKGKSGLALAIAYYLGGEDWTKVNAIDTENRSLDLFEGINLHTGPRIGKFRKIDLLDSHGYAPTNYLACINRSIADGAEVQIVDSSTHMWQARGGMLQIVANEQEKSTKLNNWTAWGTPTSIKEKDSIVKCIRSSEIHMISTIRMKEKLELVDKKIKSFGMKAQHMPDLIFEPDLVLTMEHAGSPEGDPPIASVHKSRYAIFKVGEQYTFDKSLILQLKAYLQEGVDIADLKEQQRTERIAEIERYLDEATSSGTLSMYKELKKQQGIPDKELKDFTLAEARTMIQILMA